MVCYMSSDISNMGLVMGMLNGLAHILFLHDHISCQAISCRGVCVVYFLCKTNGVCHNFVSCLMIVSGIL